jgi:hypothetical protein
MQFNNSSPLFGTEYQLGSKIDSHGADALDFSNISTEMKEI